MSHKSHEHKPANTAVLHTKQDMDVRNMRKLQTRDQKLANRAARCFVEHEASKDYRTVALGFPAMVIQAGLAQALGFLAAKGKEQHRAYLNDLEQVVKAADNPALTKTLQESAIACDLNQYRRLTRDTLDAAAWLKRIVQSQEKSED